MLRALRALAAAVLALATVGGILLGSAATASASPVPGIPLTTAKLCTEGGGKVTPGPSGSQNCTGGGDRGDVIISQQAADALVATKPNPQAPKADPPANS